jgi:hypothetical protein
LLWRTVRSIAAGDFAKSVWRWHFLPRQKHDDGHGLNGPTQEPSLHLGQGGPHHRVRPCPVAKKRRDRRGIGSCAERPVNSTRHAIFCAARYDLDRWSGATPVEATSEEHVMRFFFQAEPSASPRMAAFRA